MKNETNYKITPSFWISQLKSTLMDGASSISELKGHFPLNCIITNVKGFLLSYSLREERLAKQAGAEVKLTVRGERKKILRENRVQDGLGKGAMPKSALAQLRCFRLISPSRLRAAIRSDAPPSGCVQRIWCRKHGVVRLSDLGEDLTLASETADSSRP